MLFKVIFICLVAASVCQNRQNIMPITGQMFTDLTGSTAPSERSSGNLEAITDSPSTSSAPTILKSNDDLDQTLATPTLTGSTPQENKIPSPKASILASVTSKPDGLQDLSCTTTQGQAGECVPYFLCNDKSNTSIGLIDLMVVESPCQGNIDTCCLTSQKVETPVTKESEHMRAGCGWRNSNGVIIDSLGQNNGETKFAEFPWVCAILKIEPVSAKASNGQKMAGYIGGGSLIHPSVVLTAAHFVASSAQLRVRAGEWDTQSIKEPYPYQDREVVSIKTHEDFKNGNLFYDIAVLFLSQPMDLAPNVGMACLPPPRERVPDGTRCFATGWGKDKFGEEGRYQVILKKIEVPVVERVACQTALRKTRLGEIFQLHTSFMCAGGEAGKDTCIGDGGSPLSCPIETEDGRYMQSGIVSWGIGCGEDGTPGVYVDVSNLRSWVDDKVAGKGYDPKTYSF